MRAGENSRRDHIVNVRNGEALLRVGHTRKSKALIERLRGRVGDANEQRVFGGALSLCRSSAAEQ